MTHGCRMLLLLANFGKESKPEPIIAKISQETLAEMIGTTRSRVSFFMNKFRELGFIAYNGGVEKRHRSSQLIVECRSARPAANQNLILLISTQQPPPREGGLRRRRQKAVAEFEFVKAQLTGEKPNLGENRKTNVDMR